MEKRFHCGHFLFEIYLNVDSWCKKQDKNRENMSI